MKPSDIVQFNREAWNRQVAAGNRWTIPVSPEAVAAARRGDWSVLLTPAKPVPAHWFGDLKGKKVLGLASGGGQQMPLMAAAGADVTLFDLSPAQLAQDRAVAEREGLQIRTVEGDMRDLSAFDDESFDLIFHPCSNCFVPEIQPVWNEAFRVLRPGGTLLSGIVNPVLLILDLALEKQGIAQLKYAVPYSDLDHLDDPELKALYDAGEPMSFGHSLEDQLGGQMKAGFQLIELYEDSWPGDVSAIHKHLKAYIATRALKPR